MAIAWVLAAVAGVVTPTAARFECGKTIVVARFTNGRATLNFEGREYRLGQVQTIEGARYAGAIRRGQVEFWTRGEGATLRVGRKLYPTCVLADLPAGNPSRTR